MADEGSTVSELLFRLELLRFAAVWVGLSGPFLGEAVVGFVMVRKVANSSLLVVVVVSLALPHIHCILLNFNSC